MSPSAQPEQHPFIQRPHRTLLTLAVPVLFSLIAEPLTGLVDTAFVARLGAEPLAALGVGTMALSSIFWIFGFLGIGSQTEVAQALGRERYERAARIANLAFVLSLLCGALLIVLGLPAAGPISRLLGAEDEVRRQAIIYMRIRLWGAPAVLLMLAAFGVLRGRQDMRTPLWIAVTVNVINMALDALLITGYGPIPALGVTGAAAATAFSQWVGALWAASVVLRSLGRTTDLRLSEATDLLKVGRDLFLRTGMLTFFLLLTTRVATQAGAESGAAHQAIRQFWTFTALGLDALAITAQSLVGYFIGAGDIRQARRVAAVSAEWAVALGAVMAGGMWIGRDWLARLLVPPAAWPLFLSAWLTATWIQPINALAFVTDGIHWGTRDFRFLRNAVFLATGIGAILLFFINPAAPDALNRIWLATNLWIGIRAGLGVARVWPGIGNAPLKIKRAAE
ncbi:MAG: MATE family efflux transporter [Caldilineaceae bacterium]|nr:MATE family efflux transporter [Caldilineaceae bacterium]